MHSEKEIRQAISTLLQRYGDLDTAEVKTRLSEVLTFDADDKRASPSRPGECKIIQRIGNIVSHQSKPFYIYEEGFAVDKSKNPALFTLNFNRQQEGTPAAGAVDPNLQPGMPSEGYVGFNLQPGTPSEVYVGFNMQPGTPSGGGFAPHLLQGSHSAQKIDWDAVNERRTSLGKSGEAFVMKYEIERVRSFDPQTVSRVCHISEQEGDGLGYDIRSVNCRGETIYIEVKTTQGGADTPFYMSINELNFFSANPNNAFIYRVYDFDPVIGKGEVRVIASQELFAQYAWAPISFSVRPI